MKFFYPDPLRRSAPFFQYIYIKKTVLMLAAALILCSSGCSTDTLLDKIAGEPALLIDPSLGEAGLFQITVSSGGTTNSYTNLLSYSTAEQYNSRQLYNLTTENSSSVFSRFFTTDKGFFRQLTTEDLVDPVPADMVLSGPLPSLAVFTAPLLEGRQSSQSTTIHLTNYPCPVNNQPLAARAVCSAAFTVEESGYRLTDPPLDYRDCTRITAVLQLEIHSSEATTNWSSGQLLIQKQQQLKFVFAAGQGIVSMTHTRSRYNGYNGNLTKQTITALRQQ